MKKVLVVYHSQSGNTEALARAVREGADSVEGVHSEVKAAAQANAEDLLSCDAVAFGTPDFFSYMAGLLKDFFDRVYYEALHKVDGKAYAAFVSHGGGGKAVESVERICGSLQLQKAAEPLLAKGKPDNDALDKARELGKALAESIR